MERVLAVKSELISQVGKEQFGIFVRRATRKMSKPQRRLIREMVWGILMSQSVRLSKIVRWIVGTGTQLLSRVKRMSGRLRGDWDTERLKQNHLEGVGALVGKETSVVIDISDIRKDRGEKFEYLSRIYDGSTGETAPGYNFITVTGVLGKGRQMPLYLAPYSTTAPAYESENKEILRAVESVVSVIGSKGVWVGDRGFDNQWLFNELVQRQLRFLFCAYHERKVVLDGKRMNVLEVVNHLSLRWFLHIGKRGKKRRGVDVQYGSCKVQLPPYWDALRKREVTQELWLLVVSGYKPNRERTFFYTNVPLDNAEVCRAMVRRYADRWAVEEEIEFLKQRLQMEDVRVRRWKAIERVCLCVMLAFAFLVWLVERLSLKRKRLMPVLCSTQSELDPDASFIYYRVHEALQLASAFVIALDLWKSG
ncbi:MAG: hypothetical protein WEB62_00395 [Bacteroidota bacterium]